MKNKLNLIVTIITLSIFLFMTVGFAIYNKELSIRGNVKFAANGEIAIVDVDLVNYSNITNPENPSFDKDSINFNLNFTVPSNSNLDDEYMAEYDITISNTTFYDYSFASAVFNPSIETTNNPNLDVSYETIGIEVGDIIPKLTSKTFKLVIYMYPKSTGDYNVSGDSTIDVNPEDEPVVGSLLASIPKNSTIDLRNPTVRDKVTVTVINSYETSQNFSFNISNSNFKLVTSNGNNLGTQTIAANTTQTYDVYIERKSGVTFATDYQNVNLTFVTSDASISLGNVKVLVTKDETLTDDDAPIISNVNATFVASNGAVNLSWNATDVSGIDHFIIEAVDSNDNVTTFTTNNSNTTYQTSGLANGTYYFKVYGVDTKGFSGKTQATECTTNQGKCSRSTSATYTWVFPVTFNLTNISSNGATTATIGTQYTATLSVSGNYNLPNNITVSMNGTTLNNGYTYTRNNGRVTINNVTGPITITATATGGGICLVKGTKVLLANGKYKNIEDIKYTDLLSVWSYDSGNVTYEYPIWLEKTSSINSYQHNVFSDGSVLNTVGYHGVFSKTHNQFISVDDYSKFKVGTKIIKVVNGKLKEVTLEKIEMVNEKVDYYHVVSTRYYNIIANDFLTTDGTVILSNLYGFDKNITWPKDVRNNALKDVYSYDELKDALPYYMFIGLRAYEGKYLNNYGLDLNLFKYYLKNNQSNETMLLPVQTNKNGKRLWKVTTDRDSKLNNNLYEEGSYYTLPKSLGVTLWYSTSEDKYYKPLDKVKVNHGMHFIGK